MIPKTSMPIHADLLDGFLEHGFLNDSLPVILAKDRHHLQLLQRSLKKHPNADKQKQLTQLWAQSAAAVARRCASVPKHWQNNLDKRLPVVAQASELIAAIQREPVIIVAGETGSGKTTQLPKLALLAGRGLTGQIGHTQPRRLAARSVAARIADELGEPLGQTVSFKVRFGAAGDGNSLIKLMTDGILLAELAHDPYLTAYDTLIIDEAHERSLNIDFILGYVKQLLPKRPDLKLIITSATLDTARFAEYFAQNDRLAPVYTVEGRSYPVEVRYRPWLETSDANDDANDNSPDGSDSGEILPVLAAIDECWATPTPSTAGDILIFAATEVQIHALSQAVAQRQPFCQVLTLFARQSLSEQNKVFAPAKSRRIIIATNIAETALTVPNIGYVIDLGMARMSRYNYRARVQRLPIEPISQASANQRAGRCGRVRAGLCVRLYSEADFLGRPLFTEPEILRTNLASVVLQMAALGLGDVADFDFITPPEGKFINDGKKLLQELGAMQTKSDKTTKKSRYTAELSSIGKQMARMPIDPRLARMLLAAVALDCLAAMLVVVSALAVADIRERPREKAAQADQKHALFRGVGAWAKSDFAFYLNAFAALFGKHALNGNEPLSVNARRRFARMHFFNTARVREWQQTHAQLRTMMQNLGHRLPNDDTDFIAHELPFAPLHQALLTGLLSFVAQKTKQKGEYLLAKNQKVQLFPASVLHKKAAPWLMAFEVVETSKVFMRQAAAIEPEWILQAGKDLLHYQYFSPHWVKKLGRVRSYAHISLFGLVLTAKALVNYDTIDPPAARKIFIQEALLGQDDADAEQDAGHGNALGINLPFLTYNSEKIRHVQALEDKLRRRDLLASDDDLYRFYDSALPPEVNSRKRLQDFIAQHGDSTLRFADSDVLLENSDYRQQIQHYPSVWQGAGLSLPLAYAFNPGLANDGVAVSVPKSALAQVDSLTLLWGVAGWRDQLLLALLKTLPKDVRRKLVPMPASVQKLLPQLEKATAGASTGLLDCLCQCLQQWGLVLTPSAFNPEAMDSHLLPIIAVLDDDGRVIDQGRDLSALQRRFGAAKISPLPANAQHSVMIDDFPKDFIMLEQKQVAGASLATFCALTPTEDGVRLTAFDDMAQALQMQQAGVLALIKRHLGAKQKQLTGQIDRTLSTLFAPLGTAASLKRMVVDFALQLAFLRQAHHKAFEVASDSRQALHAFCPNDATRQLLQQLPLTVEEFLLCQQRVLAQFLPAGQEVLEILRTIFAARQRIEQKLQAFSAPAFAESVSDIRQQLEGLKLGVQAELQWQHYGRYLQALEMRLERMAGNLSNNHHNLALLALHKERLQALAACQWPNVVAQQDFSAYRWLVEEYRIALFAQPMKTAMPVSEKRLQRAWDRLKNTYAVLKNAPD